MINRTAFKIILIALATLLVSTSCKEKDQSSIDGTIKNIDNQVEVKLLRQEFGKVVPVQTVRLTPKKSTFKIGVGKLEEPTFFQLHVEGTRNNVAVLLLEPGEKAVVNIDLKNFMDYEVEGANESLKTKALSEQLAKTLKTLDSLNNQQSLATTAVQRLKINEEYEAAVEKQREFSTKFIWENPMSRASVMALYQKVSDERFVFEKAEDIQLFKVVASSLIARYPDSEYSKGMLRDIKNQEKILTSARLQSFIQVAESSLPEIALPNPKGDTIRLSSLKGKVILLDFWASFSQENLLENRELLELYKRYNSKGFEIYQISLDIEREPWLAAIESGGLPWVNVSELNPNGSRVVGLYNVTRLPANYLIGRNYDIVGKNLFGRDLESKLKEIL
ncbi:MAG: TlpA disulfide reductase family protein [Tenuifilaceae bacterium]|jgi:peroxiredoxin|nr:TlpA disulfide reductase family protein [Tenuifilaceae bacterium]